MWYFLLVTSKSLRQEDYASRSSSVYSELKVSLCDLMFPSPSSPPKISSQEDKSGSTKTKITAVASALGPTPRIPTKGSGGGERHGASRAEGINLHI